jgi:hypothetical protein
MVSHGITYKLGLKNVSQFAPKDKTQYQNTLGALTLINLYLNLQKI